MRISLLLLVIFLTGCFASTPTIEVSPDREKILCPGAPKTTPMKLREVEPTAVADASGLIWVGLSGKSYENLGKNMQDITLHINERRVQVRFYRECIAIFNDQG